MIVDIDVTLMKKLGLKLNQYVYVFLLLQSKKELDKLLKTDKLINNEDITLLKQKQIITEESTLDNINLTKEFKNNLNKIDYFEEFYEKYPTSVTRPDGVKDFLRANLKKSKEIYNKTVKNSEEMHNHILRCLDKELKQRKLHNSMKYMKKMFNWLSQEEWRVIQDSLTETPENKDLNTYGTDIE